MTATGISWLCGKMHLCGNKICSGTDSLVENATQRAAPQATFLVTRKKALLARATTYICTLGHPVAQQQTPLHFPHLSNICLRQSLPCQQMQPGVCVLAVAPHERRHPCLGLTRPCLQSPGRSRPARCSGCAGPQPATQGTGHQHIQTHTYPAPAPFGSHLIQRHMRLHFESNSNKYCLSRHTFKVLLYIYGIQKICSCSAKLRPYCLWCDSSLHSP